MTASFQTLLKKSRADRAQELVKLINRAQQEETNWMYAAKRYGGQDANVIRNRAVEEWKRELAQLEKEGT